MAGALVGLVASFGRAAYVAFAASILYLLFARQPSGRKWLLVSIASTSLLFVLALPGLRLADMASETYRGMMDARSGSSRARQMVYDESWAATQEAPLLGHGWMGEDISEKVPIPVGSHSCFYGILYTGGAMTFAAFCLAALLTFGGLAARAGLDPLRQGAAATFLSLLVLAYGELICGFSYTTMPILFWVGMALRPAADEAGPDAMANAPETP
jgi:O-antigen ligase